MNNKKMTIILLALLIILAIIVSLRTCNIMKTPADPEQNQAEEETKTVEITKDGIVVTDIEESIDDNDASKIDIQEIIAEEPPLPEPSPAPEPLPVAPKPQPKKEPVKKSAAKVTPKQNISKTDLPQPAVRKPKRETVQTPQYKNKSGFTAFQVYGDIGSKENHYSPYGFMGDVGAISIDQGWKTRPRAGKTSIKITYDPSKGKIGWSGIYWTEPANNWGDKGFGFNLTGAEWISFWVRGEKGGEIINNFIMGGIQGKQWEDSDSRAIGPIELSNEWQRHIIFLDDADLTNIIGGFCVTITKSNNPEGAVFYLDDIIYE